MPEFLSFGFIFNFNKKLVTQIFKASLYIYMYRFKPTSKRLTSKQRVRAVVPSTQRSGGASRHVPPAGTIVTKA